MMNEIIPYFLYSTYRYIFVFVAVILLGYLFFVYQDYKIENERKVTYQQGNQIIEALNKYRIKNKHYPEKLLDLSPNYIEVLPKHPRNWLFTYKRIDDEAILSFGIPTHWVSWPTGRWCKLKDGWVSCYHIRYYPELRDDVY